MLFAIDPLQWFALATSSVMLVLWLWAWRWTKRYAAEHRTFAEGRGEGLVAPQSPAPPQAEPQKLTPLFWVVLVLVFAGAIAIQFWGHDLVEQFGLDPQVMSSPFFIAGMMFLLFVGCLFYVRRGMNRTREILDLANAGDIDHAIRLCEERLQKQGPNSGALNELSVLYAMKKDWSRAFELVSEQLALSSQQTHLYSNQGLYLLRLGRLDEAEASFRQAGPALSDDPVFLCNYAELLVELNRKEDARKLHDQAVETLARMKWISRQERQIRQDEIDRIRWMLNGKP
ncbi:hypothetical protein GC163_19145 [bacterium]|nr:hypothetical protein [bacterium]